MKFLAGAIGAFALSFVVVFIVVLSGVYNVAATAPETALEQPVLHAIMRRSVQTRASTTAPESWSEDQIAKGFKEYAEMCVVCHAAPGKERSAISKGMLPQPPKLGDAATQWNVSQLFWIVKNGVRMTGMPAFGPTHNDEQIWNLVGFVRRLPQLSAREYEELEEKLGKPTEHQEHH